LSKNVIISKINTSPRRKKTRGAGIKMIQKIHEKKEMPPVMFVGSLYKAHAVKCSKIADVHGKKVHWKFVCFRKNFPIFITHDDCLRKTAKFVYKNTRQSVATISNKCYGYQTIWPQKVTWRSEKRWFFRKEAHLFPQK